MIEEILAGESLKFKDLEIKIFKFVCIIGCLLIKLILEKRDRQIAKNRDKGKYRHKGYKKDCVKTIMGEVEFRRVVYEVEEENAKKYIYLLDNELEIDTIGKVSKNLAERMIDNVCKNSYRGTAKNICQMTNQTISHEGIRNITLKVGKEISNKEKEKVKLYEKEKLEKGKKEIPALFEEADGLWVSLQGKDRKQAVENQKKKAEKVGKEYKQPKSVKSELKLYVSYEGWKKEKRHSLVGKQYITGFMKTKELHKIRVARLYEKYDIKPDTLRVLNGDGASWIKKLKVRGQFYQKDSFHISQAINRNIKDKEHAEAVKKLIDEKKYTEIPEFLERLKYDCGGEEKAVKKLETLQKYLKDGLERYKDKITNIPNPPDRMEYRNLGIMESQVFTVLSCRLKNRRMSFSKTGATMLSKVVAYKIENQGKDILESIESSINIDNTVEEWINKLEEQTKKLKEQGTVKLPRSSDIKNSKKPFEGSALTKWIKELRSLCSIKSSI
jgi:hypothetical protein